MTATTLNGIGRNFIAVGLPAGQERKKMGAHIFHQHPVMTGIFRATMVLWALPELIMAVRLRSAPEAHKADRGSKAVVIGSIYVGIVAANLAADRLPRFSIEQHRQQVFVAGIVICVSGMALRWYSIYVLGRYFTFDVAISPGQMVIEEGPYRWVRHPSYLGGLLSMIGFGLALTNWMSVVLAVCCMLIGYAYRIPLEERALVRGLGPAYSEYMGRTWRLVPFVF
jgi:protein-S-isoprenylcysteine O-methyltransferase Ste14